MKKLLLLFVPFCLVSSATLVQASSQNGQKQQAGNGQKQEAGTMRLSFDDLRAACLNPAKFHNQVAPTNIQISCKDIQAKWVPDTDGTYSMGNQRQVTAAVFSDKYTSDAVTAPVPSSAQVVACPRFKQIAETVESVRGVTCSELVEFTGTAVDFCTGAINSLRTSNPQAVNTTATGQTIDLCAIDPNERGQK